jgi:hypothetical protein
MSPLLGMMAYLLLLPDAQSSEDGHWDLSPRKKIQVFWGVAGGAKNATLQLNIGGLKPDEMPPLPSIKVKLFRFDRTEIAQVQEPVIASTYSWDYWTRIVIFVFPKSATEEAASIVLRIGNTSYIKRPLIALDLESVRQ